MSRERNLEQLKFVQEVWNQKKMQTLMSLAHHPGLSMLGNSDVSSGSVLLYSTQLIMLKFGKYNT
ncbi:hypothetical protein I79_002831 [Cricetulus griseus]|uniref:Uncharacterized protein n=1 Tax=Cricetulus griseus TaxID=10029 RepID=G3GYF5_CRIGR|nr:hypothetical protein I79_002831 [Cricetulus griseus]